MYFADLNGDGRSEVIAKRSDKLFGYTNYGYSGNGTVNWGGGVEIGTGWLVPADAVYFADLSGDGFSELIKKENGVLSGYTNWGYRADEKVNWDGPHTIGTGWSVGNEAVKFA